MSTETPFRILIVDDVPNNIMVAGNILREQSYKIVYATSGFEALKRLKKYDFDLILLDIMMPGMDGFEVCRRIRSDPLAVDIPIIFLTAKTNKQDIVAGFELGAVDYVTKPFNGPELLARVKTHLQLKRARAELQSANLVLERVNRQINIEKAKSDGLLLNILPARVADELKEKGSVEPETFPEVTVFMSDIAGFTRMAAQLTPKALIDELNFIFTGFDNIMERHDCERIKTLGDAYLAVCGMPQTDPQHAVKITRAAHEILDFMMERNKNSDIEWQIRIGIHTGEVIGGIVGVKKYIYDVFGDTINIASRMESNGIPMRINISETTYSLVKDSFPFEEREPLEVKGKGKMRMYFLKS